MTHSTHTPPPGHEHESSGNDRFSQRLSDSAHQVWLAGLGAFNRAQSEGSRLFDSLVRDGQAYEQRGKSAADNASTLQDNLAAGLGQARERTARTWDKVEHAMDDQVQSILRRLKVPTADEVTALHAEIAALRQRIGQLEARPVVTPSHTVEVSSPKPPLP